LTTIEAKIFKHSLILPSIYVFLLWVIAISENILGISLHNLGVYPRTLQGIPGILFMPLIHADFKHLLSNSVPLLVMGTGIIYFYRSLSYRVFIIIWIITGISLWLGGRPSYHIGASGVVYGLAAFLFLSGVLRRDSRLAAISLVVVFLYGSMIWGVFPIWPNISWEGHLFGAISGFVCAIVYRHEGPQRKVYAWEIESDEDEEFSESDISSDNEPTNSVEG
jgi:membrane associated rhomboid family serine protease